MATKEERLTQRIQMLEEKLRQEKALKQKLEARKRAALQKQARLEDTRRKILVGAAVLARVERGEWPRERLISMLDEYLERADDRALFGLKAPAVQPTEPVDLVTESSHLSAEDRR